VEKEQTYHFRVRGRDVVGFVSAYVPDGDCATYIAPYIYVYLPLIVRDFTLYAPLCGPDNEYCEPNNDQESAYGPLDPKLTYNAFPDDNQDYYFILLTDAGRVKARVTSFQAQGQLCLRYPGTGAPIKCDVESPLEDGVMEIDIDNLAQGKYYIQIWTDPGYENSNDQYSLAVIY
jgi:hypothetical protein